jgi:hypothetical protein
MSGRPLLVLAPCIGRRAIEDIAINAAIAIAGISKVVVAGVSKTIVDGGTSKHADGVVANTIVGVSGGVGQAITTLVDDISLLVLMLKRPGLVSMSPGRLCISVGDRPDSAVHLQPYLSRVGAGGAVAGLVMMTSSLLHNTPM